MAQRIPIPLYAHILNLIGSLLLAWGILEHFDLFHLLPATWYVSVAGLAVDTLIILLGLVCIIPHQMLVVTAALNRRRH